MDTRPAATAALLACALLAACATATPFRGPAGPIALPRPPTPETPFPPPSPDRPWVAIVIDDLGDSGAQVAPFLDVPLPLSFSILPYAADADRVARDLSALGRDVLAHVPMEPTEAVPPLRPDFLRTSMDADAIRAATRLALARVPGAIGANNHMGSRFTRSADAMRPFLQVLKARGLFFLDSRTDPATVAEEVARDEGVPTARRSVFLDNDDAPAAIDAMLGTLVALAHARGCAIAIGHPRPATAEALARFATARVRDVEVVPVSMLVGRACAQGPDPASVLVAAPPPPP